MWFANPDHVRGFFGNWEIQANGCHLWLGPFWERGHGRYVFNGENTRTHRLRWIWSRGADIDEGIRIRHLMCNNKACGNPAHLIGGTWQENNDDEKFIHGVRPRFRDGRRAGKAVTPLFTHGMPSLQLQCPSCCSPPSQLKLLSCTQITLSASPTRDHDWCPDSRCTLYRLRASV